MSRSELLRSESFRSESLVRLGQTGHGAPLRVVFDTNAILSLWAFTDSRFAPLRAEVDAGRWLALTRPDCLAEFQRVLGYPQLAFDPARQDAAFRAYQAAAVHWTAATAPDAIVLPRCKDRDDQKFLELARDAGADWLVTSDKLLLRMARRDKMRGLFHILKPELALETLAGSRLQGGAEATAA